MLLSKVIVIANYPISVSSIERIINYESKELISTGVSHFVIPPGYGFTSIDGRAGAGT